MAPKKNIVIIGAGTAGIETAQGLSKALDPSEWSIKLVSDRPFHLHYLALLRVLVTEDGGFAEKAINPLDRIFQPGRPDEVVVGNATSVQDGVVNLEDGRQLPYDYLVLATGTTWAGPLTFPKSVDGKDKWIADWREKFRTASDIVILGAGAVGIELSGELKNYYPNKNVTVIHGDVLPMNTTYPDKFRRRIVERWEALGVNFVLGDRGSLPQGDYTSITTDKGQTIKADLVVPTWGGRRNTAFLKSFDPTIVTAEGNIRVLPTLRVPLSNGKANVYAVGDVIDWQEQKQLAKVPYHVAVVVPNILASIQGQKAPKVYGGFMEAILLPAGPSAGVMYLPLLWGIIFGDWVSSMLKAKTLFVAKAQALTGYA
ncbi:hypothetical protein M407DRAFT_229352 [Tulasnella calospora MUT 4182]|uniref:FAD/NAD(P)-binding domain-containing protein n=1 Tax=Tulasnella calospora MUT 4182 TaxID=1051891 RepID=A0A0C3QNQ3_9AGAM|nr:hypothetical protein M407DRAFT_229352 [Tulasnella calospora MUT 4182]